MKLIRSACAITLLCAGLCGSLFAQAQKKLEFEVASIKPAPAMQELMTEIQTGKRGIASIQTTIDNARADFGYTTLNAMIIYAFTLKPNQVVGPDWLGMQAFEIHAKLPDGASKEQVPQMMQSLLADRFNLAFHRESKEQPVYALVVAKDGPKLKEATAEASAPAGAQESAKTGSVNGGSGNEISLNTAGGQVTMKQEGNGMVINSSQKGQMRIAMGQDGTMAMQIEKASMSDFVEMLNGLMDRPVVDMTDLKGSYQIALEIPMAELLSIAKRMAPKMGLSLPPGIDGSGAIAGGTPGAGGPGAAEPAGSGIMQAIQKLGLKLDSRKLPVETFVVDRIEKLPTEN
jgi:uncharacterized protein (TIGR03435 family)